MLTNTGYCSDHIRVIKGPMLFSESNHDLEMLRMGGYPDFKAKNLRR